MVQERVVQPGRVLGRFLARRNDRVVREGGGVHLGERVIGLPRVREVRVVEGHPVGVAVGEGGLVAVAGVALELDHVGGVVGDDIHEHLDAAAVGVVDQAPELVVGAEVRIHL